ncbi:alpha/beta hydrolase [Sphingomonas morindae]|uniref:Alpha/beta hydrolase n=1 Tax=Sphingomonas morindae TaxID=1541170 RepID=A0ABY4XDE8_9SPHN|nr:alpha/beta hydrolase [Sphingomonas morindae]USI74955.1 alpha/beta hydrolase [Sphingomonas morindae]
MKSRWAKWTMSAGLAIAAAPLCAQAAPAAAPAGAIPVAAGPPIRLWPQGAPGAGARAHEPEQAEDYWVKNVHDPSLTLFRPPALHQTGTAIIVIPGGGHRLLVWTNEGIKVARALNRFGITALVLKYRLAREPGSPYDIPRDAAEDARRAVRYVRQHAAALGVDPHRIGVMGFSAGGELVSLIADNPAPPPAPGGSAADPLAQGDARPDFQVLVFPGPLGIPAKAVATAPPAFITAGSLDACCAAPSVQLYEQLRTAHVPAELHMYAGADHAFNLDETDRIAVLHWPDRLADWLADQGLLNPAPPGATPGQPVASH